ncbi:MAG: hypothetical protein P0S95_06890 [Rhabdochlamydiaceae bacterium]|nr:hypothetical protein [Candidatus Amphrikana amoebophyrae]
MSAKITIHSPIPIHLSPISSDQPSEHSEASTSSSEIETRSREISHDLLTFFQNRADSESVVQIHREITDNPLLGRAVWEKIGKTKSNYIFALAYVAHIYHKNQALATPYNDADKSKDVKTAQKLFTQVMTSSMTGERAKCNLRYQAVFLYYLDSKYYKAIQSATSLLGISGMQPYMLKLYNIMYLSFTEIPQLKDEHFTSAVELASNYMNRARDSEANLLLSRAYRAKCLFLKIEKELTLPSEYSQYLLISAATASFLGRNYSESAHLLNLAMNSENLLAPELAGPAFFLLGELKIMSPEKQYEEAIDCFKQALTQPISSHYTRLQKHECLYKIADAAYKNEDWKLSQRTSSLYCLQEDLTCPAFYLNALYYQAIGLFHENKAGKALELIQLTLENQGQLEENKKYDIILLQLKCNIILKNDDVIDNLLTSLIKDQSVPDVVYNEAFLLEIVLNIFVYGKYKKSLVTLNTIPDELCARLANIKVALQIICSVEMNKIDRAFSLGKHLDPKALSLNLCGFNLREQFLFSFGLVLFRKREYKSAISYLLTETGCEKRLDSLRMLAISEEALSETSSTVDEARVHRNNALKYYKIVVERSMLIVKEFSRLFQEDLPNLFRLSMQLCRPFTIRAVIVKLEESRVTLEYIRAHQTIAASIVEISLKADKLLTVGVPELDYISVRFLHNDFPAAQHDAAIRFLNDLVTQNTVYEARNGDISVMNSTQYRDSPPSGFEVARPEIRYKVMGLAHYYLGILLKHQNRELARKHNNIACSPLYSKYLPQDIVEFALRAKNQS